MASSAWSPVEGVDDREGEDALGVGLGLAGERGQGGQSGPGHGDGQGQLGGPVKAHDQGLDDRQADVVELVDGDEDPGLVVAGHLAELHEQPGQIGGQVAGVGRTVHGVHVDAELGSVGELDAEGLQDPEGPEDPLADASLGVHGQEHPAEGGGQTRGQVAVLGHLDVLVEVAPGLGQVLELVEQDGLSHAPQTGEHLAPPVAAEQEALEGDVHGLDLPLPADQGRWTGAGPGAVGVPDRVHGQSLLVSDGYSDLLIKIQGRASPARSGGSEREQQNHRPNVDSACEKI